VKYHLLTIVAAALLALCAPAARGQPPLKVVTTIPDLASLAREVGGDQVDVTSLVKGPEDPHFLEARPSFIKAASEADVFIQVGLELEVGWAPPILLNSRNARIQPGTPGFIEASSAITPVGIPTGPVDRSMGDIHASGNPHFLTDPICGLQVARLIADRFSSLRPAAKEGFESRYTRFRERIHSALVGEELAKKYDAEKLAILFEHGRLESFLKSQNDEGKLGGWLGQLSGHAGVKAIADHDLWPYFARRYNLTVAGFLEPKPGISPTTGHLREVVDLMKTQNIKLIIKSPYFDPRHASFVAEQTGATTVTLAHQVGSLPGTDDYLAMCDYNVRQLAPALKGAP
jgi:ABC-type Zn uptake system ZnuABC Zn-binding protein ZnuA